ncbi:MULTISPECIES: hypothetical protein [unclassified Nocardia]|uniref:hypothetical protein n=1 Tax=unclassified Nocardia TaxID=2637762 RepID=UPI00278BF237|nr:MULTISPECIES: hypothetical protein [unclassified Nocardia]
MKRRLKLTLTGHLDQTQLDELRKALLLSTNGTAADPVGTQLGTRTHGAPELPEYGLTLWRSGDDEWSLSVDAMGSLPITHWQGLVNLGIRAAGLTIRETQEFSVVTDTPASDKTVKPVESALPSTTRQPEPTPVPPPIPKGPRKPDWTVLSWPEITVLATRLIGLDPAWRLDPGLVARTFGWPIRQIVPDLFQLDTGPETAKGYIFGAEGESAGVEVPVSMPVPDDDELRLGYVFTLLTPTLTEALGRSALPPSGRPDEVTWGNDLYRLNLVQMPTDIRLFLTHRH